MKHLTRKTLSLIAILTAVFFLYLIFQINFLLGTRKTVFTLHASKGSHFTPGMPIELSGVQVGKIISMDAKNPQDIVLKFEMPGHYVSYLHPDAYVKRSVINAWAPKNIYTPKLIIETGKIPGDFQGTDIPFYSDENYLETNQSFLNRMEDNVIRFLDRLDTHSLTVSVENLRKKIPAFGRGVDKFYKISQNLNSRENAWGKFLHSPETVDGFLEKFEGLQGSLTFLSNKMNIYGDSIVYHTGQIREKTVDFSKQK